MKCPKCDYLGLGQVDRCRNCGYEFSLAVEPAPELPLMDLNDQVRLLEDLSFLKETETRATPQPMATDLLLFEPMGEDDQPLITKPSPPRQPLAVRRATLEVPRTRSGPRPQSFDLAFDAEPGPATSPTESDRQAAGSSVVSGHAASLPSSSSRTEADVAVDQRAASLGSRFLAVVIDLLLLTIVDVLVVYFTMELCGITFFELGILPKAPLLTFLAVQNGGYLVGFTAGGQTLGKMALGIRVVTADEGEGLGVGRALQRTVMWALLAIPAGLGFLTAVFSSDHRGLHDRLAGTRVVRASA